VLCAEHERVRLEALRVHLVVCAADGADGLTERLGFAKPQPMASDLAAVASASAVDDARRRARVTLHRIASEAVDLVRLGAWSV
jgi:hypothetical protein